MKQTAVDYLFEKLWGIHKDKFTWQMILKEAKKKEKKQIEEAWIEGGEYSHLSEENDRILAEQYYKENYEIK
jgi:hypothetical protein